MRGFGFVVDLKSGMLRRWYLDLNGIKRWADNDEIIVNYFGALNRH